MYVSKHVTKRLAPLLIALVFFSYAPFAHAQVMSDARRAAILDQIQTLLAQVQELRTQLSLLVPQKPVSTAFSFKTTFYRGKYEALYAVDGNILVPQEGKSVRAGDQLVWNTFADIAGENFIDTYISEFRVYNDTNSEISAFVEQRPDQSWIVGFNREGESLSEIYNDATIIGLLLHEYSHIVFFTNGDAIERAFKKTFWNETQSPSDFITEYARTNATEDMIESFVYFVQNEKPKEKGSAYDKVRFFYSHPELVTLRQTLRKSGLF